MSLTATKNVGTANAAVEAKRPEWGDAKAVREVFGIGRSTLYNLAARGRIKTVSLRERGCQRGKRLFSMDSIAHLLESRATGGEIDETGGDA